MSARLEERLPAGSQISHYRIEKKIGEGGMGTVYLAKDLSLRRSVALKILPDRLSRDQHRLKRFEQEAVAASGLNHPNILTIHEFGEAGNVHYIASEYVDGKTLREKLPDLTVNEAVDIAIQIASSLEAAHASGIIHRDIKPENIMVRDDGLVKVLDFGLAKLAQPRQDLIDTAAQTLAFARTEPGMVMGTASYMSPEQARGQKVDKRTDLWSLGVVLYEMLTRCQPFPGQTTMDVIASILNNEPSPLPAHVPSGLRFIISRALQKSAEDRYPSSGEILADLRSLKLGSNNRNDPGARLLHNNTAVTVILPTSPVGRRLVGERKQMIVAGLAPALLLVAVALYFWGPRASQTSPKSTERSPAYDLYVRGKVKIATMNREDNVAAAKLLEQAVAIDPDYAEAWAALAEAYNFQSFYYAPENDRKTLEENAKVAVEKALELNPNLAEGHFARGLVLWNHDERFPHEQTIQAFKRAIALNPNLDDAYQWLATVYIHIGLLDEALDETQKGLAINPNNSRARFRLGVIDIYRGDFEGAVSAFKTVPPDVSPADVNRNKAIALLQLGHSNEAEAIVDHFLKDFPDEGGSVTSIKAILLAKAGKRQEAEQQIQRAIEIGRGFGHFHHTAYQIACAYAILHQPDEALKWLNEAADDGFPCYPYYEIDHNLDDLRGDRKFAAFMADLKKQWLKYKSEYSQ